eukprot:365707-Chlamydomonas_euryale.AAC.18
MNQHPKGCASMQVGSHHVEAVTVPQSGNFQPINFTSLLAGWAWYGVAQDHTQWHALCDSAQPAA